MKGEPAIVDIHKCQGVRPPFDVYIGRHVQFTEFDRDSKWHNPFSVRTWGVKSLAFYEYYIRALLAREWPENRDGWESFSEYQQDCISHAFRRALKRWGARYSIDELTGQRLGCWCVDDDGTKPHVPITCHGQVLRQIWREEHAENRN